MKITRKNLEKLFATCKYSPERIGETLLKLNGYKVTTYNFNDSVYVEHPKSTIEKPIYLFVKDR